MFQTRIEIPVSNFKITYEDGIMGLGSCFAENMGNKMKRVYFKTEINPFGVLYNPVSIRNSIKLILNNNLFTENDIFEYKHLWQSFSHSSLFTDISKEGCLNKINSGLNSSFEFLKQTHVLLVTFGTAWIFEERKSGRVVSNCHKLPANEFLRRRLTVDEIVNCFTEIIIKLQHISPDLNIIFSVSPIRHWKDGAHENNISKGILLLAIDELQKQFEKVHYFPAYEILMDELRDYRFYASDMLHPSEVAVDYIWNCFSDTYFTKQTLELKKRLEQLVADFDHRPIHPDSIEYKNFLFKAEERKEELKKEFPFLSDRIK
jgi:hypothetical protein